MTAPLVDWFRNVRRAISTIGSGLFVTLATAIQTYRRKPFTTSFAYPENPVPIRPRYRGYHRFDLTACIGCDKCARACPVDCIYIDKEKAPPPAKGFVITGFKIDYTKCMFCALCVDPCPADCLYMGSNHDISCYTRDGCIVDYSTLPLDVAWGQDALSPTAIHESKKVSLPVWTKT
jgi:NADH-quinone oxidoreductase subunit I